MTLVHRLFGRGPNPEPGQTFGDYMLLERIGEGKLSYMFRGENTTTGEVVAVKVLTDYGCDVADKLTRKLKKDWEGERAVRFEHPNVVRTFTQGVVHGRYYLVMEYLRGGNVAHLIRNNASKLEGRRVEIMREAGQGLAYVHGQGTIHRDICPQNVLLGEGDVAKLIDFGVSADKADRIRNTGTRTGRPAYMAPELIRSNHFDERTDIYAFGMSLYEMCTGTRPLRGNEDTFQALAAALNTEVPPPSSVLPSLNPRLERLILRCLETRAQRRFPSMLVLLEALEAFGDDDL
ncbi:serine/threonine protein kinase [bacterium]|nr:serine/threonine protein kinase [bacterium]